MREREGGKEWVREGGRGRGREGGREGGMEGGRDGQVAALGVWAGSARG
jgi:hypothetical protein